MRRSAALIALLQGFFVWSLSAHDVFAVPIPVGQSNALRVDVEVPIGLSLANDPISIEFEFSGFDSGESFSAVVFHEVGGIKIPPRVLWQNVGGIFVPFSDQTFVSAINGPAQTAELFVRDISAAAGGFTIEMWMNVGSANLEGFTATAMSTIPGGPVELIDSLQNGGAVPEPSTLALVAIALLMLARRRIGRAVTGWAG
jgi:hypothetical protein